MVTIKEINTSIGKINLLLERLDSTIEERERLVNTLRLTPSTNDNYDLINLLGRSVKSLTYLQDDLIELIKKGENASNMVTKFKELATRFLYLSDKLENDIYINLEEFKFEGKELPSSIDTIKSVRFKDNLVEYSEDTGISRPVDHLDSYRDDPDDVSFDSSSNLQIFAQHHQTLLDQDHSLDQLHDSIKMQHSMGVSINQELEDHIILLDDLEQGVDLSQRRLNTASSRLNSFRKKCKENGSLVTIIILTIILILLLVVLN